MASAARARRGGGRATLRHCSLSSEQRIATGKEALRSSGSARRPMGAKARLHAQNRERQLEALLPQEALHGDVQRLVLDRQLVDEVIVGGMVVHGPAGGRQHEIARL